MREILTRAVETGSHDIGDELRATISRSSTNQERRVTPPRSFSRQNSNMVNTPPRDSNYASGESTYIDENGDHVRRWEGDEEPGLRVHNYDPEWNDQPKAPSRNNAGLSTYRNADGDLVQAHTGPEARVLRTHSQHSPPPSEGRRSPPIYQTRDREGNLVSQYDGDSGDLPIRTHYHDDEPQQGSFQRTNSGRY
ncbi:hypothetical protein C7212DRAFT_306482 [Tuber magnatum]|uniref:Uncharacterized protein n=1 Tax=Tuber magnatum TaxID=42249 RepID=A0A317T1V0_9PEZI|nr:hypothetical protein C7212DRAFT_306482 [Tuber magnatum]